MCKHCPPPYESIVHNAPVFLGTIEDGLALAKRRFDRLRTKPEGMSNRDYINRLQAVCNTLRSLNQQMDAHGVYQVLDVRTMTIRVTPGSVIRAL